MTPEDLEREPAVDRETRSSALGAGAGSRSRSALFRGAGRVPGASLPVAMLLTLEGIRTHAGEQNSSRRASTVALVTLYQFN